MKKHIQLTPFLLLVVLLIVGCKNEIKKVASPNIIYVMADDLGYGDIGAFNPDGKIKTPHIDQLAQEGMRFTDAHTSSSVCTPTRYSLLTGRYNWRSTLKKAVLVGESSALIEKERATVASVLQKNGYATAFIGKWHLGWNWAKDSTGIIDFTKKVEHNPNDLGFDYTYGHAGSLDMPPYVYVENGHSTAIPVDSTGNSEKFTWWRQGLTAPDFIHEEVTPHFFEKSINYVSERANADKPFFLYLALPSPHTPILPTGDWHGKSGLNPYADFMMQIDHHMGQLNQAVKVAGIEDNTIIVFTSDNGCSPEADITWLKERGHAVSGPWRGQKADIWEGGHRIPYIVKWPKIIRAGTENAQTISNVDLMATCAALVGYDLKDNEGEDSYNLLPLWKGETVEGDFREATVHHAWYGDFAIRQGDWKLITCAGSGGWSPRRYTLEKAIEEGVPIMQLYNLKNDPVEQENRYEQESQKAEELLALLTRYVEEGRSTPGIAQKNDGEPWWPELWWINKKAD
ncbi:MAG: arylsulfatase [Flavobacteriaceae bacterium]|nr:arylsulfatase [Flavobacteriaceae bacterium]